MLRLNVTRSFGDFTSLLIARWLSRKRSSGQAKRLSSWDLLGGPRRIEIWGDWSASRFTVSAPVGIPVTKRCCVFTGPLEPSSLQGPKVLDFYAGFFGHRVTCLKADGKDVTDLKLILNSDSKAEDE